jgi:hypothetical protein
MALITGVGLFVVAILTAALSKLAAEEIVAWTPAFACRLTKLAVRLLPRNKRDRFAEEWQGHLSEIPGNISKIVAALGFIMAACRITICAKPELKSVLAYLMQVEEFCAKGGTALNTIQQHRVFVSDARVRPVVDSAVFSLSQLKKHRDELAAKYHELPRPNTISMRLACAAVDRYLRRQIAPMSQQLEQMEKQYDNLLRTLASRQEKPGNSRSENNQEANSL